MATNQSLQNCLREQAECAAYIQSGGPDHSGAWQGLSDWIMEEILIRKDCGIIEERELLPVVFSIPVLRVGQTGPSVQGEKAEILEELEKK